MTREGIAKIIYEELCYMYCNNCRYNSEIGEDDPSYGCDDCHRKYNGWGISMAEAERIAEMIGGDSESRDESWTYTLDEVAEILTNLFGDDCACNYSGIDEWLPQSCKYAETECPDPKEKHGCWKQFLLQGAYVKGVDFGEDGE